MRYFDALEAMVTLDEAVAELRRHEYDVTIRETDKAILDVETGDEIGYLGY